MNKTTIATLVLTAGALVVFAPSIAAGDAQSGLNLGDNDSLFVDGNSFQVIPGKAKGDAAAQIRNLHARDLGPAALIVRSGNKLYIADAQSEMAQAQVAMPGRNYAYDPRSTNPTLQGGGSAGYNQHAATDYAYDPRSTNPTLQGGGSAGYNQHTATDYAYDPRSTNPTLQGGGSAGYNQRTATNYAYDPRPGWPVRNPDPWANDYAYDPRNPAAAPSLIYDSDYVEYRLKKAFQDNWTPMGASAATK